MSPRGLAPPAELRDCYPLYGRAKNLSAFHQDVATRRDSTQFPCNNGVLSNGINIWNGDCQHTARLVFSTSSCFHHSWHWLRGTHALPPSQNSFSMRSNANQYMRDDKLAGLLRSHHIAIERLRENGDPKVVVWVSALTNDVNKYGKVKQRPEDIPFQEAEGKQKMAQVFGGLVLSLAFWNKTPPHSLLSSPLLLRQLHLVDHWELGFIQHLKICSLRLLLQALAKFLPNKHLPVKLKIELLIKWILYLMPCWLNWFSFISGRKA